MTAGDGDAEQLRVPRWIAPSDSSGREPDFGSDDSELTTQATSGTAGTAGTLDPDDGDEDPNVYVPRRYSPDADSDERYVYEPDFDDLEYPTRPSRRAAWKDTLPRSGGAERLGADDLDEADDESRRGRRHAATPRNRRLVIAWIAAAVVIAVALPLGVLLFSSKNNTNVGASGQRTAAPPRTDAQPSVNGVSIPGSQPDSASPSVVEPTGRSNAAPNPGQFGPITYEAEAGANKLAGSAAVVTYPEASGGRIVRNIGDWGITGGPGTLRFETVDVPAAGTYSLTFFHVNIDNERVRTAVITVDGIDPILVTITGSATCCLATTIKVTLKQGRNSITFSNNSSHAPSIDKITISQP
jgi:hypothetical protein